MLILDKETAHIQSGWIMLSVGVTNKLSLLADIVDGITMIAAILRTRVWFA